MGGGSALKRATDGNRQIPTKGVFGVPEQAATAGGSGSPVWRLIPGPTASEEAKGMGAESHFISFPGSSILLGMCLLQTLVYLSNKFLCGM